MSDLIDRDDLLEHVYRDRVDSRELIAKIVMNAPTKRTTAHWIEQWDIDGFYYRCSHCGEQLPTYNYVYSTATGFRVRKESIWKTPYCPYCGYDMRSTNIKPIQPEVQYLKPGDKVVSGDNSNKNEEC